MEPGSRPELPRPRPRKKRGKGGILTMTAITAASMIPGVASAEQSVAKEAVETTAGMLATNSRTKNADVLASEISRNETPKKAETKPQPIVPRPSLETQASPQLNAEQEAIIEALPALSIDKKEFLREILLQSIPIKVQKSQVNIPVMLAQAIIETGWGESIKGNNLFGIKIGTTWAGASQTLETQEWDPNSHTLVSKSDEFRVYPSYTDSFNDYVSLITAEYPNAVANYQNPTAYAQALESPSHVYATGPNYVATIVDVLQNNQLVQLNQLSSTEQLP